MLINKSVCISLPSLLKYGWGFTLKLIIKSPAGPPYPEFPFFETLRFTPLSTPFGILIVSVTFACVTPFPRHVLHGCLMTVPTPSQFPQTCYIINGPCRIVWNPAPPHAPHFDGFVPGLALLPLHVPHKSVRPKVTCFWTPFIESIKSISTLSCMSLPL